jgi:hypothetical protein
MPRGRPARVEFHQKFYLYALAAAGQAGVERALANLRAEIERDMKLMGCRSVDQLIAGRSGTHPYRAGAQRPAGGPPLQARKGTLTKPAPLFVPGRSGAGGKKVTSIATRSSQDSGFLALFCMPGPVSKPSILHLQNIKPAPLTDGWQPDGTSTGKLIG